MTTESTVVLPFIGQRKTSAEVQAFAQSLIDNYEARKHYDEWCHLGRDADGKGRVMFASDDWISRKFGWISDLTTPDGISLTVTVNCFCDMGGFSVEVWVTSTHPWAMDTVFGKKLLNFEQFKWVLDVDAILYDDAVWEFDVMYGCDPDVAIELYNGGCRLPGITQCALYNGATPMAPAAAPTSTAAAPADTSTAAAPTDTSTAAPTVAPYNNDSALPPAPPGFPTDREVDSEDLEKLRDAYAHPVGRSAIDQIVQEHHSMPITASPFEDLVDYEKAHKRFEAVTTYIACFGDARLSLRTENRDGVRSILPKVVEEHFPWSAAAECPSRKYWHDVGEGYCCYYTACFPILLALDISGGKIPVDWDSSRFGEILAKHMAISVKFLLISFAASRWDCPVVEEFRQPKGDHHTYEHTYEGLFQKYYKCETSAEPTKEQMLRLAVETTYPEEGFVFEVASAYVYDATQRRPETSPLVVGFRTHQGLCFQNGPFESGWPRPCMLGENGGGLAPTDFCNTCLDASSLTQWARAFPEGTRFAFVACIQYQVAGPGTYTVGKVGASKRKRASAKDPIVHFTPLIRGHAPLDSNQRTCGSLLQLPLKDERNKDDENALETMADAKAEYMKQAANPAKSAEKPAAKPKGKRSRR